MFGFGVGKDGGGGGLDIVRELLSPLPQMRRGLNRGSCIREAR